MSQTAEQWAQTTPVDVAALKDVATRLRIHSVEATSKAGSGHPTSCCSIADIMSVLFFDTMRFHVDDPHNPNNDRFILSKGHAAPILYAAWAEAGKFPTSQLLNLRQIDSDLEGHPTPRLDFVDVATGSLGQGLSVGCGMAYAGKYLDHADYRVYCLMGDGESAEGSVWEALSFASFYHLDNLVAIFDINRLGQSEPTMFQHDVEEYYQRLHAFDWNPLIIDGHSIDQIRGAFETASKTKGRPTAIIAKTLKGKGLVGIEDHDGWHGKPLGDLTSKAILSLRAQLSPNGQEENSLCPTLPSDRLEKIAPAKITLQSPDYSSDDKVATRAAYGTALAKLGSGDPRVIGLDGDTKNSTFAQKLKDSSPGQFIECYIAEQNLVGVGVGLAALGKVPFVSTFACFLMRAADQIRMAGISQSSLNLVGSHCGISIGEDGPSQMALEDLAFFRTIPSGVVFYPSDAVSCERAIELAANSPHLTFTRTSRPATPILYDNNEAFAIGKGKVVRSSGQDDVTVVAAGITLFEALKAAEELAKEKIFVRIIDPFTIKPLDRDLILANVRETGGRLITVEDHYAEGGIGDAVAGELAGETGIQQLKMAVNALPRSGPADQLLRRFGISSDCIVRTVRGMLNP